MDIDGLPAHETIRWSPTQLLDEPYQIVKVNLSRSIMSDFNQFSMRYEVVRIEVGLW